jgi:hypothetical protein
VQVWALRAFCMAARTFKMCNLLFDCAHQRWLRARLNVQFGFRAQFPFSSVLAARTFKMFNFLFDCAHQRWRRAGLKCTSLGLARISVWVRAYFLLPARILVSRRVFSPHDARILVRFRAKIPEFETRILVSAQRARAHAHSSNTHL